MDEEGSGFKAGLWAFLAIGILALGLLAFLVIRFVAKREPKGETVVMKQSVPAAGTSAPSAESVTPEPHMDAVAQADAQVTPPPSSPRTLYGKAIVKAKNVVAVNDAHAADAAELLDDKQPPVVATPKAAPPSAAQVNASPSPTPAPMPAAAEVVVEEEKPVVVELPTPTPTPTPRPTPTPPPPSSAFRYFVVQMKVNGVFQGSDPRAVLNGRIFHEGEMVDPALGIMLLEIDTDAKKLIFREPSGAIMPRRY